MAAKKARGNRQGSTYRFQKKFPDGRVEMWWRVVATVHSESYVDDAGKKKYRLKRVSGEHRNVNEAEKRFEANLLKYRIDTGEITAADAPDAARVNDRMTMTVQQWLSRWMNEQHDLKEQTRAHYDAKIRNHVCARGGIGDVRIRRLTRDDCSSFMDRLKAKTNDDGSRVMGETTRRQVYFILRQAFDDAINKDILAKNPMATINPPKRDTAKKSDLSKLSWLIPHLMQKTQGTDDHFRWMLACIGMRQSEVLGLTDDCISLAKNPHIVVKQQLARHVAQHGCGWNKDTDRPQCGKQADRCTDRKGESGLYLATPKTTSSVRKLSLQEPFLYACKQHMRRQRKLRETADFKPVRGLETLVFTNSTGRPRRHQNDSEAWKRLLKEAKVDDRGLTLHDLRHLTVSYLVYSGFSAEQIQAVTGWSTRTMLEIYSHQNAAFTTDPIKQLGDFVGSRWPEAKTD